MNEPPREIINRRIVELLEEIVPGGIYTTSPKRVSRKYQQSDQVPEYPWLIVTDGPGSIVQHDLHDSYRHEHVITVWGYVRAEGGEGRATLLERLWADVLYKMLSNATVTIGGEQQAMDITVDGERETDEGLYGEIGVFAQDYRVKFIESIPGG